MTWRGYHASAEQPVFVRSSVTDHNYSPSAIDDSHGEHSAKTRTLAGCRIAADTAAAGLTLTEGEKEVVDTRLTQKVTCAFKGTALADLCVKLKADTGIHLVAGPSVVDEKVTLFCEKQPLRDVMRQLSWPFGYTWLRDGAAGNTGTSWCRTCAPSCWKRSCETATAMKRFWHFSSGTARPGVLAAPRASNRRGPRPALA